MCKDCGCNSNKLEKIKLNVKGMSCNHCKNAVEKAVRGLPGVMAAEVDLAAGLLTVDLDSAKTTITEIKQAVEEAGYEVA
jgi:copper chaperone